MTEITEGRALDALVAESLMGYSDPIVVRKGRSLRTAGAPIPAFRTGPNRMFGNYDRHWLEDGTKLYCGKPFAPHFAPEYSTDIAMAWDVVEKIQEDNPGWRFSLLGGDQQGGTPWWSAEFFGHIRHGVSGHVATAALAICIAALAAKSEGGRK